MSDLPMDLAALEFALRDLSHDESAVQLVRSFAQGLGKTKQRQQIFNTPGAFRNRLSTAYFTSALVSN